MEIIPGVDTIQGLVGEPPPEIPLSDGLVKQLKALIPVWNNSFIAIIPYCFKCKVPLDWHIPPDDGELFTCPTCGRDWVGSTTDE